MRVIIAACSLLLSGCAITHKVELQIPGAPENRASVAVVDDRLDPSVKLQTVAGTGGGFMLLETTPPIQTALEQHLKIAYTGDAPLHVGIERLELLNKVAFMAADDMTCGIESKVKVGSAEEAFVRTRLRNTENKSPVVATMARALITTCLEAHARDISANAAATQR